MLIGAKEKGKVSQDPKGRNTTKQEGERYVQRTKVAL